MKRIVKYGATVAGFSIVLPAIDLIGSGYFSGGASAGGAAPSAGPCSRFRLLILYLTRPMRLQADVA